MRLVIDFETASNVDLEEVGAWAYAEHPTTEILCAAWVARLHGREGEHIWIPGVNDDALEHLTWAAGDSTIIFEAHNASFEQAIWRYIMERQYGMPPIPPERWDCTMARCLYNGLPAKLETAAEVLGLAEQKDMVGSALTLSLSKPMSIKTWMRRMMG